MAKNRLIVSFPVRDGRAVFLVYWQMARLWYKNQSLHRLPCEDVAVRCVYFPSCASHPPVEMTGGCEDILPYFNPNVAVTSARMEIMPVLIGPSSGEGDSPPLGAIFCTEFWY